MTTVRDNAGTVLEHLTLSVVVGWACARRPDVGTVTYVDTHSMAPVNVPTAQVGDDRRVSSTIARPPQPGRFPHLAQPYAQVFALCEATSYPTHFIHAIRAAQAAGKSTQAWLFENDAAMHHEQRSQAIQAFLDGGRDAFGVEPDTWAGAVADHDFRMPWNAGVGSGQLVVVMSDPDNYHFAGRRKTEVTEMDADDLGTLWGRIVGSDAPSLLAHVMFCRGGNLGGAFEDVARRICGEWMNQQAFQGLPVAARCVRWGAHMVLVGIMDRSTGTESLATDVNALMETVEASVSMVPWRGRHPLRTQ